MSPPPVYPEASSRPANADERTGTDPFVALIFLAFCLRLLLALGTEIYADEAYYWTWAQHPALGYFDHPPLLAWTLMALPIRYAAFLYGIATAAAIYLFARELHGTVRAAVQSLALWCVLPAAMLAGVIATPDSPVLFFWPLTLWAAWRRRWAWAGVALGLAGLSKYSAVLLALALLATLAFPGTDPQENRKARRGVALALGIAALLQLPVVYWNAHHGWASFRFQLHHGLGGGGGLRSLAEFVGGQLLMGGPLLLLAFLWPRSLRTLDPTRLLRGSALLPLAVFALASLRARGEANWADIAYPALALAAGAFRPRSVLVTGAALVALCAFGTAELLDWPGHPHLLKVDVARLHGWTMLGRLAHDPSERILAPSYQLASEAAYFAHKPVAVLGSGRPSQFDLWTLPGPEPSRVGWLSEGQEPPAELTRRYGPPVMVEHWPTLFRGRLVHDFYFWRFGSSASAGMQ